jgi:hypothetical protein
MTNPLRGNLLSPLTLKLPCGDSVDLPRYRCLFRPWQGQPISDTYGGKAVLDFEGSPVFPELAILETLQGAGWDGVWVDTFRNTFRRAMPPDYCVLPQHAQKLYDRICRANGGKTSGCFDVLAWKDSDYLLVESKRQLKDSLQATQEAWVEAALRSGIPLDSLLICEWELEQTSSEGGKRLPGEKALDQALEKAFKRDDAFRQWFLSKTKQGAKYSCCVWSRSNYPWAKVKVLLPNEHTGALEMVAREGETDVLAVFEEHETKRRLGIHIENKLASGHFTPFQPEVCAARADFWVRNADYGNYDEWETVLLAPVSFFQRNVADARKFTTFISHEDVAVHLSSFRD